MRMAGWRDGHFFRIEFSRLESEIQNQTLQNQALKQCLVFLRETLNDAFGEVTIAGIDFVPSVDTSEDLLKLSLPGNQTTNIPMCFHGEESCTGDSELFERVKESGEEGSQETTMDESEPFIYNIISPAAPYSCSAFRGV